MWCFNFVEHVTSVVFHVVEHFVCAVCHFFEHFVSVACHLVEHCVCVVFHFVEHFCLCSVRRRFLSVCIPHIEQVGCYEYP